MYDVLAMLSNGMSQQDIQDDFPELTSEDILAVLAYAADVEHQVPLRPIQIELAVRSGTVTQIEINEALVRNTSVLRYRLEVID